MLRSEKLHRHDRSKWSVSTGDRERQGVMKPEIHPKYQKCIVTCGCGHSFETRSAVPTIAVEICSACHPFFTGMQKFVDTAGRVEKFQKKFGGNYFRGPKKAETTPAKA